MLAFIVCTCLKFFFPTHIDFFKLTHSLTHSRFLLDGCAFLASFHVKFVFICSICSPENGILWTSKKVCTFFRSPCINNHWICKWNAFVCYCAVCRMWNIFILFYFGGLKCSNMRSSHWELFMHSNALKIRSDLTWSVVMKSIWFVERFFIQIFPFL